MNYTKPEVQVLGDANQMIQGFKGAPSDSGGGADQGPSLFELEE